MILKIIYTIFLALMVALFVGLGIDAFYPGPSEPEYPLELERLDPLSPEAKELKVEFEKKQRQFEKDFKIHSRNVSLISLMAAILILVSSLTFLARTKTIAEGVLLGGVFITCYAIIQGMMTDDSRFRFWVVCAGLLIALVLGYVKFIKPQEKPAKKVGK